MAELVMPRLSDTMEEGTILRWLVADGQQIERGQEIVEIETDKATMAYESDLAGVLKIVAAEGETLPVGALIAHVGDAAGPGAGEHGETSAGTPTSAPAAPANIPSDATPTTDGERVKASPLARRLARERGVDLHRLAGSGPGGRIVKADVAAAGEAPARSGAPATSGAKGESVEVELTRTQQTIARRMAESKATIPHFALRMDVDMEECAKLREQLKRLAPAQSGAQSGAQATGGTPRESDAVPTYNDMVVKAAALALREHPRANSSYRDGRLQLHARVNVGVAVAVDGEEPAGGALVVPTVFDADVKALGEIARETRTLAGRVREGAITPPELGGGTFTVSNLGMFGIASFTAIVNPPQAAILSVGAVAARAVAFDGEVAVRQTMTITLACDHRALYGADAARFLARIRELLQAPASLTL